VRVIVVRPEDLGPAEIDTWQWMQHATTALGNPFLSPEFSIAAAQFRPTAQVAVLMDGCSVAGYFPFERHRLGGGAPICGWLTPCQGLVHAPGVEWDPKGLLQECRLKEWQFNNLIASQRPFQHYQVAIFPSPLIDVTDGFADYYARLRTRYGNFCRELKRKERKLAREIGELRFVANATDVTVMRTLMTWKSEQYRRTGLTDRFRFPWVVGLLDALLATRGDHMSGLLCALYAGDQPVAGQFGLRSGKLFAGWFTAYNSLFAKYSPGLIQTMRLVEELANSGVQVIDMGNGPASYKEILKTRDAFVAEGMVTLVSGLAVAHRVRWTLARQAAGFLDSHTGAYRATLPVRTALRTVTSASRCAHPRH
jgi:CelD/BcsL family acetyltransferase involved in cellulose biosynthesis